MRWHPMNLFNKPYRHRHMLIIIKLAVILYNFVSSRDVKAILYYAFRIKVSHKGICEWAKKFPEQLPRKKIKYKKKETVILFADEKYVWIKNVRAYWWSVRDHLGNVLAKIITFSRDAASAEELFRRAKEVIDGKVHAVVRDGLKSYNKPIKKIFGRKCLSIVAGIKGRLVIINKGLYWITNNSAESLNAQIDNYIARHHYNFNNLESANYFADMFMNRKNLRDACS
jgi:transposase-like protein